MTTIVTRAVKGTPLSWAEADANFTNLNTDKAELASPAFTGTPTVPTAVVGTNTTQVASTAYTKAEIASDRPYSDTDPIMDSVAAQGTSPKVSRQDHVHPSDTTKANIASPTFTGVPAGPTASVGTNTTQLATTAFVMAEDKGPVFIATTSTATSVTNVATTLPFEVEVLDTHNCYDHTTGRFTPNIAGYYLIEACVSLSSIGTSEVRALSIVKNSSTLVLQRVVSSNLVVLSGSVLVSFNGTTDYVYCTAYQLATSNVSGSGYENNRFTGHLVQKAA